MVWDNIPLKKDQSFKMTMTIKGSKSGKLDGHLGDWGSNNDGNSSTGASVSPEVTGIESVKTDKAVDTSNGIYNLNGMRMSATSLDELPAGIYISNGKKVLIK